MVDIWHNDWTRHFGSRRWRDDGVLRTDRQSGTPQYAEAYGQDRRYWELKCRYLISNTGDLLTEDLGEVAAFLDAHRVDAFYYKDIRDYYCNAVLQSAASSPWQLRRSRSYKYLGNATTLTARYEDSKYIITAARGGRAVIITDNGAALTEGVNFSIDYDTGLVTWLGGYTPTTPVLATYDYYYKVRTTGPMAWDEADFEVADFSVILEEYI